MALLVGYGCEYHATGLFDTCHFAAGSFCINLSLKRRNSYNETKNALQQIDFMMQRNDQIN